MPSSLSNIRYPTLACKIYFADIVKFKTSEGSTHRIDALTQSDNNFVFLKLNQEYQLILITLSESLAY
jgi:hypothetical protein